MYVLLWQYAIRAPSVVNKLNIMVVLLELLRSYCLLYIFTVCAHASRRAEWTTALGNIVFPDYL